MRTASAKLFALVFGIVLLAHQSLANIPGCHVIVNAQSRHTSYESGGLTNTPYDLNIVNIGTCNVEAVYLNIDVQSAELVQQWNLDKLDSSHYLVENTAYITPNGQFNGAGYIVGSNDIEASVIATLATAVCQNTGDCADPNSHYSNGPFTCVNLTCDCYSVCIEDGGLPRCEAVYQTCSNPPPPPPVTNSCQASASIVARPQGFWVNNGSPNQIYDITVQNSGQCSLTAVQLQINLSSGQNLTQSWNLDANNYLTNFGGQISPSSSFSSAGIIVQGAGTVTVSVKNPQCASC
eukprot:TRINITY_DN982_c0_g1_i6.p1 TRINITY_DN982_c0_g1~~TRINITY_DN982_c0_g1_i6.p1  ORF type:complete len:293 (-),score=54.20 TRINITY_DN982_c0_g1_i6:84-962(-)